MLVDRHLRDRSQPAGRRGLIVKSGARYILSIFANLGDRVTGMDRRRKVAVKRLSRDDLPDWIASTSKLSSLTVTEAKGCHDPDRPEKALVRAWAQAGRMDITTVHLAVKNLVDEVESIEPLESDALFVGLLQLHIANLVRPFGYVGLASALHRMIYQPLAPGLQSELQTARALRETVQTTEAKSASATGGLVGGIVTRVGLVADSDVAPANQEAFARLNLRPVFVGVGRDLIRADTDADSHAVPTRLTQTVHLDEVAR